MDVAAVLLVALSLGEPAGGAAGIPAELPEAIYLKTPERTFSRRYEFALVDGRIWWKLRQPELGAPAPRWAPFGPGGLPFQQGRQGPDDPRRIASISADATGLVAVADDGRIYDADIQDASNGKFFWNYGWGFPWRIFPDKVWMPEERRAWTYSLLNLGARYSEDMDGNPHTIIGVDSVFVIAPDGRELWFNDPWLPPNKFEFRIAGPERGAYAAVNISASGSLVMLIDRRGRIYTRLVDFDTLGGNPGINYSYERASRGYQATGFWALARGLLPMFLDVRSLPPEPWRRQPDIPEGRITSTITVLQTGEGNSARELRVQGTDAGGAPGYWHKTAGGEKWSFRATGQPIDGPFLDPQAPPEASGTTDERCEGHAELARPRGEVGALRSARFGKAARAQVPAVLSGFNVGWDPARIDVPAGSGAFVTLHLRPWSTPVKKGVTIRLLGTLELPGLDVAASGAQAQGQAWVRELLGGRRLRPVFVYISDEEIRVESDPFGAAGAPRFAMRFPRAARR